MTKTLSLKHQKGGIKMEEKAPSRYKVICSVCGETKAVRPAVYEARVVKFGSVEKLNESYVCRKCKKEKANAK